MKGRVIWRGTNNAVWLPSSAICCFSMCRAKIFQVMKCSLCKRGLTLPAVHFLCQHSFHRECHPEEYENECQICAKENRSAVSIMCITCTCMCIFCKSDHVENFPASTCACTSVSLVSRKVLDYIQKQGEQTNLHENFHAQVATPPPFPHALHVCY